eukprot:COSAG02_NODE_7674_length_2900_cov_3.148518_1_plen_371_part_00
MARAAVVCVACLMLFVAVQACHGNCPTHSHDAGTIPLACQCLPDAGYTFLAVANCPCGYGQVISDCTQCPRLMTNDERCRIMAGPHGKDAGSSGPSKHCGCDAGYQLTSADGHDACIALAAKCSCTETSDDSVKYIGWGIFFLLICCGDNILKCCKRLVDQDDALATELAPSDVEGDKLRRQRYLDSIAAAQQQPHADSTAVMSTPSSLSQAFESAHHDKVKCLKGFTTPHDETMFCDVCMAAQPEGALMKGCRTCDYDICASCSIGWSPKQQGSTNEPPTADATEVYVPPTMEVSQPDGTSTTPASRSEPKDLAVVLQEASLSQYETALRELGAAFGADLVGLEEDDLVEIGMKKLEVKRLLRIAQQVQ